MLKTNLMMYVTYNINILHKNQPFSQAHTAKSACKHLHPHPFLPTRKPTTSQNEEKRLLPSCLPLSFNAIIETAFSTPLRS